MRQVSSADGEAAYLSPTIPAERMLANMRSALDRGLPEARLCRPHNGILSIAAGGPSLLRFHSFQAAQLHFGKFNRAPTMAAVNAGQRSFSLHLLLF